MLTQVKVGPLLVVRCAHGTGDQALEVSVIAAVAQAMFERNVYVVAAAAIADQENSDAFAFFAA